MFRNKILDEIQENLVRQQVQLHHLIQITEELENKVWKGDNSLTKGTQEHNSRLEELESNQDTILKVSWSLITSMLLALTAFAWNTLNEPKPIQQQKPINSSQLLISPSKLS